MVGNVRCVLQVCLVELHAVLARKIVSVDYERYMANFPTVSLGLFPVLVSFATDVTKKILMMLPSLQYSYY
jgi:hypothetical protein